jgi:hypothetical protein
VKVHYEVVAELLNEQGEVIGQQNVTLATGYRTSFSNGKLNASTLSEDEEYDYHDRATVTFEDVDANKMSGSLRIRIASLDGVGAQDAAGEKKVSIMTIAEYQKALFGREYKTGDRGPAGGIMLVNGIVILEVAPANTEFRASWDEAMSKCSTLQIGGTSGWQLPTKYELNTMYLELKRKGFGGFSDSKYWSSSESDWGIVILAWSQNFDTSYQTYNGKDDDYSVRAVRAF